MEEGGSGLEGGRSDGRRPCRRPPAAHLASWMVGATKDGIGRFERCLGHCCVPGRRGGGRRFGR